MTLNNTQVTFNYSADLSSYTDKNHAAWCTWYRDWVSEIMAPFNETFSVRRYPHSPGHGADDVVSISVESPLGGIVASIMSVGGIQVVMSSITAALTRSALFATSNEGNEAVNFLNGTSHTLVPIVIVRWRWLTLPVFLSLIGLAFLASTAYLTHKLGLPTWKSSVLAPIYHGLEAGTIDPNQPYELASDMHNTARTTYVQLRPLEDEGEDEGARGPLLLRSWHVGNAGAKEAAISRHESWWRRVSSRIRSAK